MGDEPSTGSPFFSVVTPVYNTPLDVLDDMIMSVRTQTEPSWELVLVDDCSPREEVRDTLRQHAAADPRVRVVERATNGHIVRASNDGLAAARAPFIALVDHDDLLLPHALERMRAAIEAHPDVDYLYSDEDKIDPEGQVFEEFAKPAWSPERLRSQMYTGHLSVYRASLVREVGGFHEGFEGSQDHDLALRVTERARLVVHLPEVLYHWRVVPGSAAGDPDAKPYAWVAGVKAVQAHLDRLGIPATADYGPGQSLYRIDRRLDPDVLVSVVIPTRGADGLVWGERRSYVVEAVRSLVQRGGHRRLEVVVVHDTATPQPVLDRLAELGRDVELQLVPYDRPFDFSEKCNIGVLASHGEVVVLMNDDTEVGSDDFLVQLVAPLFEDGVGMTGARLQRANSLVQHAGMAVDTRLEHMVRLRAGHPGPFNVRQSAQYLVGSLLTINREVSALSAACLAVRRSLYLEVGGLSEQLPVNFGDVDLCLKVRERGFRLVYVAHAKAWHFEASTREPGFQRSEVRTLTRRWALPDHDPYLPGMPESVPRGEPDRPWRPAPRLAWQ